jgi:hypothetical protein
MLPLAMLAPFVRLVSIFDIAKVIGTNHHSNADYGSDNGDADKTDEADIPEIPYRIKGMLTI